MQANGENEGDQHTPDPKRLMYKRKQSLSSAYSPASRRAEGELSELEQIEPLSTLSFPPTKDELQHMVDIPVDRLPKTYKRELGERVFVNRHLALDSIKYWGWDMDYTVAEYKSPAYESMSYNLILSNLIQLGYPKEISSWEYDPNFATRGLLLDIKYGNLLKLDSFANILVCVHGRTKLTQSEMIERYPSRFITVDQIGSNKRFMALNTLFDVPQIALFSDLVAFMDTHPDYEVDGSYTGVKSDKFKLNYTQMYNDLKVCVDIVHDRGSLKEATVADLEKYVVKDARLITLLQRLKDNGKFTFLATNSGWEYTNTIMTFLFADFTDTDWKQYFDVIIVDARKPLFFAGGTALRQVNLETGALMLGCVTGKLEKGNVYSGGSSDVFCQMTGAHPKEIMYIGDHIFGDILKSKKQEGWRTFLVVPELERELNIWRDSQKQYRHLQNLEFIVAETYREMDSNATERPDTSGLFEVIDDTAKQLDDAVNVFFGSMFRTGTATSFFASQTARYADLYAPTFLSLINYPFFYDFRAPEQKLAHEM